MKFIYAIFDMNGLMFDTERLFIDSYTYGVAPCTGMEFPMEKLRQLIGVSRAATAEQFEYLFGTMHSYQECCKIADAWVDHYLQENGIPVKDGLFELLEWLKKRGVKMAVATSTERQRAMSFLRLAGVEQYFQAVIGGDMLKESKPNPQIFLLTAQMLGCKDLQQCVIFEDSLNGMLAAVNAKIPVIVVPDLIDPTQQRPNLCLAKVATLYEAIKYLE